MRVATDKACQHSPLVSTFLAVFEVGVSPRAISLSLTVSEVTVAAAELVEEGVEADDGAVVASRR